ncbi:hypothetical protein AYJ57_21680 (plasmid) [Salipiger sp. CCB-MM3]|nr:hypothetical protein AYJ57_21680 [Salipiger sp. CCB-MM3]
MQDALRWFEQAVSTKTISLNEEQIGQYMEANGERVQFDEVESVCAYKWREDGNVTNAMMAVGRLVHKGVTKTVRGIDDFVGHPVLQNVVASIDPIYGATRKHDDEFEPASMTM